MTRKRIRDIRYEELVDATIIAIHRKGFAAVTMAEIAAEAGAATGSINYYFGSKERLLEATMRRLLTLLRTAMLDRYAEATCPEERLLAVIDANFDDRIFTLEQCSVWMQFWANAPYHPGLSRLHRINRSRVRSHFRAALRRLLPDGPRETARAALQNYMDGVWLEAAQSGSALDPNAARRDAHKVVAMLLAEGGRATPPLESADSLPTH